MIATIFRSFGFTTLLSIASLTSTAEEGEPGRVWTVADSIGHRYVLGNGDYANNWAEVVGVKDYFAPSPGGDYFFAVTNHGDLATDRSVSELVVYSSSAVIDALSRGASGPAQPLRTVTFASASSDDIRNMAICTPRWSDSNTITFVGHQDSRNARLFRIDVSTGELRPITPTSSDVACSESMMTPTSRNSAVYTQADRVPWRPLERYPGVALNGNDIASLGDSYSQRRVSVYLSSRGQTPNRAITFLQSHLNLMAAEISPDERWTILVYSHKNEGKVTPAEWINPRTDTHSQSLGFVLADMHTGHMEDLGPVASETNLLIPRTYQAFWSFDSRHVLLFNAMLPHRAVDPSAVTGGIVDLNVSTHRLTVVLATNGQEHEIAPRARWVVPGHRLLVAPSDGDNAPLSQGKVFEYDAGAWSDAGAPTLKDLQQDASALPHGLSVELRQSVNDPPMLVASDGTHKIDLLPPDPALRGVRRVQVDKFTWLDEGTDRAGFLMLPGRSANAPPPPLVILGNDEPQLHPDVFSPDGGTPDGGFAAQALVAQGMAVVQIAFAYNEHMGDAQEGPTRVRWVDEVVDNLATRGLIDRTRVGLAGFSRSGYLTHWVVTHPGRTRLSAAAVFDSVTGSYGELVTQAAISGETDIATFLNGLYGDHSQNFWSNKQGWLNAPDFNIDRVVAPVLFSHTHTNEDTQFLLGSLETIGAYRIMHRPFEFMIYPDAIHVPQRPRERQMALQTTVDWMAFWLENRDPADPERAARWRNIRDNWQRQQTWEAAGHPIGSPPAESKPATQRSNDSTDLSNNGNH